MLLCIGIASACEKTIGFVVLIIVQSCNVVFVCCTPVSELSSVSVEAHWECFDSGYQCSLKTTKEHINICYNEYFTNCFIPLYCTLNASSEHPSLAISFFFFTGKPNICLPSLQYSNGKPTDSFLYFALLYI